MKATGIVRRIDDLGRVVIPKEIKRKMTGVLPVIFILVILLIRCGYKSTMIKYLQNGKNCVTM